MTEKAREGHFHLPDAAMGLGDLVQIASLAYAWKRHWNGRRPTVWVPPAYWGKHLLDRYRDAFTVIQGEPPPGSISIDNRRRGYRLAGLRWMEFPLYYPLTPEEEAFATYYWGPQRPRWCVQIHGGGPAKHHRYMEQIARMVERLPGQTIVIDDAFCAQLPVHLGLAVAARADRFIGFDSGPFWCALAGGAEAMALFPYDKPNDLYWPYPAVRTFPIFTPGDCDRVPVGEMAGRIMEFWSQTLPANARPEANADGLYFLGDNCHGHLYKGHEAGLADVMLRGTDDGVVADIGAHVGSWTMKFAERASRVYAVEPSPGPRTCASLTAAVRGHTNVVFHACALADRPGKAVLSRECGGSHLGAAAGDEVQVLTFDDLFLGLNRLDVVKIDTEGAEASILRGGRRAIAKLRPRFVIEVHQFAAGLYDADPYGAIRKELAILGYRWRRIEGVGWDGNFYLEALPCE